MPLSPLRLAGLLFVASSLLGALAVGQPGIATTVTWAFAALLAVVIVSRRVVTPAVAMARTGALRQRARRQVRLRQCDPDASGRPRPRAPSVA